MAGLGNRGPELLRPAFARFGVAYRASGRFAECLSALKHDLADPVQDRVCEILRVAREVGGSDLGPGSSYQLLTAPKLRQDEPMGISDPTIHALLDRLSDDDQIGAREGVLGELGWALVTEGQLFLEANSDERDVDLFFETFGYPRREEPTSWVERIVGGLQQRITPEQWNDLEARALDRAEKKIRKDGGMSSRA